MIINIETNVLLLVLVMKLTVSVCTSMNMRGIDVKNQFNGGTV